MKFILEKLRHEIQTLKGPQFALGIVFQANDRTHVAPLLHENPPHHD